MLYQFVLVLALASCLMLTPWSNALGAIEFIGKGVIPGNQVDNLGLTELIETPPATPQTPQNLMGGFGSALAYTGIGNRYITTPDRGPADGNSTYLDRFYTLDIAIDTVLKTVTPSLVSTQLLKVGPTAPGQIFTGNAGAFDPSNSPASLRFDPEGVRVGKTGTIFISDEYGPFVYEFDQSGNRLRSLNVPEKFLIKSPEVPSANPAVELANTWGRQPNRGMEGLAINPDGSKLYGIMQNALIQDNALNSSLKRRGFNNRILEMDVITGDTREFLYHLETYSNGVNEILAINDHEFLVLERDGEAGVAANFKKIFKIDISSASDISLKESLPKEDIPSDVKAVSKKLFLDLLDPAYGLNGADFPEKIEGLAFGPTLPDGRVSLLVTNDNDFLADKPSNIYVFAIDKVSLTPVPGSVVLLATGLVGLLGTRRWIKA